MLPGEAVKKALSSMTLGPPVYVVAIRKAAYRMAVAAQGVLGKTIKGLVVIKYGHDENAGGGAYH